MSQVHRCGGCLYVMFVVDAHSAVNVGGHVAVAKLRSRGAVFLVSRLDRHRPGRDCELRGREAFGVISWVFRIISFLAVWRGVWGVAFCTAVPFVSQRAYKVCWAIGKSASPGIEATWEGSCIQWRTGDMHAALSVRLRTRCASHPFLTWLCAAHIVLL